MYSSNMDLARALSHIREWLPRIGAGQAATWLWRNAQPSCAAMPPGLSPRVLPRVGFGVDQLGVDADLIARPSDAPFEHVAHPQLAADLLRVDRLVPIGERGIARDHEATRDPRQIGRQILGDSVREILLVGVVVE